LQIQPVERLKSLFLQPNLASPIILLGAGASLKSGIPLSEQVVEIAARWAYCHSQGYHPDDPSIKRSDWLRWLQAHTWYERSGNTEDNYSIVLENLLQPRENRKEFFLRLLNPNVPASVGYDHLLEVLDTGRVQTVLTTRTIWKRFEHRLTTRNSQRLRLILSLSISTVRWSTTMTRILWRKSSGSTGNWLACYPRCCGIIRSSL